MLRYVCMYVWVKTEGDWIFVIFHGNQSIQLNIYCFVCSVFSVHIYAPLGYIVHISHLHDFGVARPKNWLDIGIKTKLFSP
jgi:hypothetical protein